MCVCMSNDVHKGSKLVWYRDKVPGGGLSTVAVFISVRTLTDVPAFYVNADGTNLATSCS